MEVSNIRPIAILASYISLAALLTAPILRTLYRMNKRSRAQLLIPSHRPQQIKHLLIFASLAVVSLGTTWYYMLGFFTLSYQTWAHEAGVPLPIGLWGSGGILCGSEDKVGLHLGPWLRDTKLFREAWETVVDGSIRFWWSQQIFLITMGWSVYLGIEGNRRSIPHLWTFMLLGQIVAISFAMNLSFLAILLSEPSADGTTISEATAHMTAYGSSENDNGEKRELRELKARNGVRQKAQLKPPATTFLDRIPPMVNIASYFGSLFLTFISVLLLPSSVHTRFFMYLLAVPHLVLFLPVILPSAWKQTKQHADIAKWASAPAYRLVAELSLVLYVNATISALTDGQPGGLERLVQELYNHPAVSSVGWDVILSCISASIWMFSHRPGS